MQWSRLSVPAPNPILDPATDLHPNRVRERIARLPYADPGRVMESLLQALVRLNRHPERVAARADIMTAYRVPCTRLLRMLPGHPGAPTSRELRRLMAEMAYGYKHLVNESLARQDWLHQHKPLSMALYYAAKYLSLELFLVFEAYQQGISGNWGELLTLYRTAEEQNAHHAVVQDRDQADPGSATISHVLKRITLLRLLDPYHMVRGEARACFEYLNLWASSTVLENLGQMANPAGRFLLDMEGREPPRPPDPDTLPRNPDRFRYLNLLPLSRQMQQHLHQMELQDAPPPEGLQHLRGLEPIQVLRRMLLAWHGRRERRSERREVCGWMWCGWGLGAVSHFLRRGAGGAHAPTPDEEVDLGQVSARGSPPLHYQWIRCRQVNRSNNGLCIRLTLQGDAGPQVGQLILLQEDRAGGPGDPYTGIVRRRLRIDVDTLEAGIQLIRGTVRPVTLRPRVDRDSGLQPALLVDRGDPRFNSIFTRCGLYQQGRELTLVGGQAAAGIKADLLVESSPSFDRFRFTVRGD